DACLGYIKRQDLHMCASHYKEISDALMHAMSRNLNSYIRHIANLSQKNAIERVSSYLVFLYNTHPNHEIEHNCINDSLSRVELAEMLGITQRTLIRCLNKLKQDNYITINRHGFSIHDIDTLENISSGNY
ncbi:MAG: Crp/Fnr family transcriptional regulator, partial [Gammaproteobacteria bacterium]|nr:Crp/Fnr family transcriptional regulator [Gammaproteobacteria bacterium]